MYLTGHSNIVVRQRGGVFKNNILPTEQIHHCIETLIMSHWNIQQLVWGPTGGQCKGDEVKWGRWRQSQGEIKTTKYLRIKLPTLVLWSDECKTPEFSPLCLAWADHLFQVCRRGDTYCNAEKDAMLHRQIYIFILKAPFSRDKILHLLRWTDEPNTPTVGLKSSLQVHWCISTCSASRRVKSNISLHRLESGTSRLTFWSWQNYRMAWNSTFPSSGQYRDVGHRWEGRLGTQWWSFC